MSAFGNAHCQTEYPKVMCALSSITGRTFPYIRNNYVLYFITGGERVTDSVAEIAHCLTGDVHTQVSYLTLFMGCLILHCV